MTAQEKLLASLERTSQIVKTWPQWKQRISHPHADSGDKKKNNPTKSH